jgi:hypothetical protein
MEATAKKAGTLKLADTLNTLIINIRNQKSENFIDIPDLYAENQLRLHHMISPSGKSAFDSGHFAILNYKKHRCNLEPRLKLIPQKRRVRPEERNRCKRQHIDCSNSERSGI